MTRVERIAPSFAALLAQLLLTVACGSASPTASNAQNEPSATTFQTLDGRVQAEASSYRRTMTDGSTTLATCAEVHAQYDANVRPAIKQMMGMGSGLDDSAAVQGLGGDGDFACVAASMLDELDYHRSLACSSSDLATNQAEAARHADAMKAFARHVWDRCKQMTSTDGSVPASSGMMNACQSWDGQCTATMHDCCRTSQAMGMMHEGCGEAE